MWCWLGQDPGEQETKQLQGFVGNTGKRLMRLWKMACEELGFSVIPRSEIWITNAALCEPVNKSEGEAKAAMKCCRPRLLKELRKLDENAGILSMGKWAYHALRGLTKGVGKVTGFHIYVDLDKAEAQSKAALEKQKIANKATPF